MLSSCPSVRYKPVLYRNDWMNRAGFCNGSFLPPIHPTLGCKEIWVAPKIRVFPLALCSKLTEFRKFRHSKSIALSTKLVVVVVDGRACRRHLYDSRRVAAVYYTSVNCNPLTLLGPNVICCGWICCTTFGLQCFHTVGWASGRASGL